MHHLNRIDRMIELINSHLDAQQTQNVPPNMKLNVNEVKIHRVTAEERSRMLPILQEI